MLHAMRVEWPCLSFDHIRDTFGDHRVAFPMQGWLVTGSQAAAGEQNKLYILSYSDLQQTKYDSDDDESDSSDEDGEPDDVADEELETFHSDSHSVDVNDTETANERSKSKRRKKTSSSSETRSSSSSSRACVSPIFLFFFVDDNDFVVVVIIIMFAVGKFSNSFC